MPLLTSTSRFVQVGRPTVSCFAFSRTSPGHTDTGGYGRPKRSAPHSLESGLRMAQTSPPSYTHPGAVTFIISRTDGESLQNHDHFHVISTWAYKLPHLMVSVDGTIPGNSRALQNIGTEFGHYITLFLPVIHCGQRGSHQRTSLLASCLEEYRDSTTSFFLIKAILPTTYICYAVSSLPLLIIYVALFLYDCYVSAQPLTTLLPSPW